MSVSDYAGVYDYSQTSTKDLIIVLIPLIVTLIIVLINIVALWKIFNKNNKPGWHILIPILSTWDFLVIGNQPGWSFLVPVYNLITAIKTLYNIPKNMGKSNIFSILTIFFPYICLPLLAFNKKKEAKVENVEVEEPFVYKEEPKVDLGPVPVLKPLEEDVVVQQSEDVHVSEVSVTPVQQVVTQPVPVPLAPVMQTPEVKHEVYHKCGAVVPGGSIYCPECGEKLI